MLTPPAHRRGAGPAEIAATAIALLLLRALPVSAQLSPRNANYTIDARLGPGGWTLDGRAGPGVGGQPHAARGSGRRPLRHRPQRGAACLRSGRRRGPDTEPPVSGSRRRPPGRRDGDGGDGGAP